jgi:histidinol-phosphate aminotransferase
MFRLHKKIASLTPYEPLTGDFRVRLDANESFLPMPCVSEETIQNAVRGADLRRYPDPNASELCAAANAYYNVKPNCITAFNGTDEALFLLGTSFLGAGETFLCCTPDFSMYAFYAHLGGAKVVKIPHKRDFRMDVEAVVTALQKEKPTVFAFSNPCNPTSLVLERGNVRRILAANPETLVVLDEAYMEFSDQSLLCEIDRYENLVILRTASKAVGLAGLRLGFAIANPKITAAFHAAKSPYNVGLLPQRIGTAILSDGAALRAGTKKIRESTDCLAAGLREIAAAAPRLRVVGADANFVFVTLEDAAAAFAYLKAQGIAVRCFNASLRITAGSADENEMLLAALRVYFAQKSD